MDEDCLASELNQKGLDDRNSVRVEIDTFVRSKLLSGCFAKHIPAKVQPQEENERDDAKMGAPSAADDYTSPMTIECYERYRLQPLIRYSQFQVRPLVKKLKWLKLFALLTTSCGTILVL